MIERKGFLIKTDDAKDETFPHTIIVPIPLLLSIPHLFCTSAKRAQKIYLYRANTFTQNSTHLIIFNICSIGVEKVRDVV